MSGRVTAGRAGAPGVRRDRYRVLIVADRFEPGYRAGGPVRSLRQVIDAAGADIDVAIVTRDRDLGDLAPYPGLSGRWVDRERETVFYLNAASPRQWWTLTRTARAAQWDLLYVNSVWSRLSIVFVLAARVGLLRTNCVLVAPRGEMGSGALGVKRMRKKVFLALWRHVLGGSRFRWHATAPAEAVDIRRAFPAARAPFVVAAAGPEPQGHPEEPATDGPPRLVFVGRISPMKNLDLVLAALAEVRTPVVLDVYGPADDPAYWRRCRRLWAALPPHVRATWHGPLLPDQVAGAFARSHAFVLPTRGENFGHVIGESLSVGCPVICSDRTPWTELLRSGGGEVLPDVTVDAVRAAIQRVVDRSPAQRHAARVAAAAAYRAWHARAGDTRSLLDQVREAAHAG
ncbi:glycosyltransferase [Micromonospora sp. WMMD882]|uniref:glycosyltransferase n=1 Tax=Micromonospora sp. WMMD882 TaxID=3015151 RepID=UPI00248A9E2E|nr:glycosyltransferase [Micromonospora sp. WMMD882]WBB81585.1 glycosyltransferase [Micromonospora sp. WMMD882]